MNKEGLKYNTEYSRLKVPEYGRIIQKMVTECMQIEDRNERLCCAEYIVRRMAKQTKTNPNDPSGMKVLWDHLYIMSDFSLDIDFPIEPTSEEGFAFNPEKIPYNKKWPRFRHYGHAIEKMIEVTLSTEDPELRREREILTASQMKRSYINWNKNEVTDEKIFKDLYDMSNAEIYLDEYNCTLPDYKPSLPVTPSNNGKKKKGKKK